MIRRTVRALRSVFEVDARVLARHLGISRGSLYNRLNGTAPWLAAEIVGLAQFFGCDIVDFYTGNVRIEGGANAPAQLGVTRPYDGGSDALIIPFPQLRACDSTPDGPDASQDHDQMAQLTACR